MHKTIAQNLSQASFLALMALSLSPTAYATNDSSTATDEALLPAEQFYTEYAPLDESALDHRDPPRRGPDDRDRDHRGDRDHDNGRRRHGRRHMVYACYAQNSRGQYFVAYSEYSPRRAQWEAMRQCERVSYRCQESGCRREWGNE